VDPFNVEQLIGSVIQGALGGKRKKSRGVSRFLTGGKSSFLNASTLLALGGLAWGVLETMSQSSGPSPAPPGSMPPSPATRGPVVPPPLPAPVAPVVPPPLPGAAPAARVSPDVLRVLRLTLSAARADGSLSAHEREAILAQARGVGAEAVVTPELESPRPLAEIASGVSDPRVREDLYTLAFSIVRADEQVLADERLYLEELARHLGLDATAVARLEQQAAERIGQASRE
jgi:uncharacterized membrane protein YebE (DUF533 family)